MKSTNIDNDVAIIGVSLRMPQCDNLEDFWRLLSEGTDLITDMPEWRRTFLEEYSEEFQGGLPQQAYLENINLFDNELFRLSPKDARYMHPTQRLFLEVSHEAIEDAGYGGGQLSGSRTGVYAGIKIEEEYFKYKQAVTDIEGIDDTTLYLGNLPSMLPSRISYYLDLKGPTMLVDTACSSSLVAIHLACSSIIKGETDYSLAGGARLNLFPAMNRTIGIESSSSRTKSFDNTADGSGFGEGAGVVLLKSLKSAIQDKDHIYAVIKGSSINQDGITIGITAPNVHAQADVLREAWDNANINPEEITYIEAHGTGTKLGDPIEVEGLRLAFENYTANKQFCAIGSVKSNLGHLHEAAGIAGLLKTVLMLKEGKLLPSIHYSEPNEQIDFEKSPVFVNSKLAPWDVTRKICGVSSFGLSGTNCHVVLEQAPESTRKTERSSNSRPNILAISAKSKHSLLKLAEHYAAYLTTTTEDIDDICFTQSTGRGHYRHSFCVFFTNVDELLKELGEFISTGESNHYKDIDGSRKFSRRSNELLLLLREGEAPEGLWRELCQLYLDGINIEWRMLYDNQGRVRVPYYPYDKKECWIHLPASFSRIGRPSYKDKGNDKVQEHDVAAAELLPVIGLQHTINTLSSIWEEILEYDDVDVHASFYELGGDSISMLIIIDLIKKEFCLDIGVKEFHRLGSIADIAEYLASQANDESRENQTVPFAENPSVDWGDTEYFPITEVQSAYLIGRDERFELGGISNYVFLEIESPLVIERVNASLQQLIHKYSTLRTVFRLDGYQKILEDVPPYTIQVVDLRHLDPLEQDKQLEIAREEYARSMFDATKWPLFEVKAYAVSDTLHHLFFSFDLLIVDARSLQKFAAELMNVYAEPECLLRPLSFDTRNYMTAYSQLKNTAQYVEDKVYWLSRLNSFPTPPLLNLQQPVSSVRKPNFKRISQSLIADQCEKLKGLAKSHEVTMSALLCTLYSYVLAHWSNQSQLALNLTSFNRLPVHPEAKEMLGDFTSIIPIAVMFDSSSIWAETRKLHATLLEALEHRLFDGVEFIREYSRYHSLGFQAAIPVVFTSMISEDSKGWGHWSRIGEVRTLYGQGSQVYLDHQVMENNGELVIGWDYVEQLFEQETIDSMFTYYISLIKRVIDGADSFLAVQEVEGISEHEALLTSGTTLQDLIESQAKKTPNEIAVIHGNEQMTYSQLMTESNRLAHYLLDHHVQKGDRIGVYATRDLRSIVHVLAVLKAGGTYVPIDPKSPEAYQNHIRHNSHCQLVLGEQELDYSRYSCDLPEISYNPADIAYIIYTSGSTGQPKGVLITHMAAVNTITDINRKFNVTTGDRIIGLSSLCFDLSVYDIFGALISGATLVQVDDPTNLSGIRRIMEKENITIWNTVPSLMGLMVDYLSPDARDDHLRLALLSGDWIPMNLPEQITAHFTAASVVSLGGATEASIWSIYYPITHIEDSWSSIPYGYSLDNQKVMVLNFNLECCPVGIEGELYIGGAGVAEGYQGDPEKTSLSFIHHPEHGRLYRTGDYGLLHKDGYIVFLGRRDFQVKNRGFRVELGEINTALIKHPEVSKAVTMMQEAENDPTDKKLISYITKGDSQYPGDDRGTVGEWGYVFNEIYTQSQKGITHDFSGWISSYDYKLIPTVEMEEWLDQTVQRILSLSPQRVLEIGCGTGLILHAVAPQAVFYHGIDLSEMAVSRLSEFYKDHKDTIFLEERMANDLSGIQSQSFDVIIINSVSQYFPNAGYFLSVLKQSIDKIAGCGEIFIGDIRDLSLLPAFYSSTLLYRAKQDKTVQELLDEIQRSLESEKELCIHPQLFRHLKDWEPRISAIDILPKEACYANELSKFRYDVIIHIGDEPAACSDSGMSRVELEESLLTHGQLNRLLEMEEPVLITEMMNSLVAKDIQNYDLLMAQSGNTPISAVTLTSSEDDAVAVSELRGRIAESGKQLQFRYSEMGKSDILITTQPEGFNLLNEKSPAGLQNTDLNEYFNIPASSSRQQGNTAALKEYLRTLLPSYMVPDFIVEVDDIPLTANGKIDYKSFPKPKIAAGEQHEANHDQLTPLQKHLATIWAEILRIQNIGINHNIFELGGNSIVITRIIHQINRELELDLSIKQIYDNPTIHLLSLELENIMSKEKSFILDNLQYVHSLSEDELDELIQKLEI
ncbi:non-ribosomal peptide synthetase [Paenibacillus sp. HW567]|uniref:non-ribosomal peptide synthetase n=1 Tax=Paenibacillus sp. HW567 TaxID=1034769 RepID=UPI000370E854|nr:non-ribosomal peptide synthetase [Paenibacillus sp. HW567]